MQTINIVPVLVDKENAEGLKPVKLAVYIGRKRSYITTGIRVKTDQWDAEKRIVRKNHPNASSYNTSIALLKNETEKKLIDQQNEGISLSVGSIRKGPASKSLVEHLEQLVSELRLKYSPETIDIYENEIERIKAFDKSVTFEEVNHSWLRRYEARMIESGLASNTIHKAWKILRKAFNSAIADKITGNYPFKGFDNPKYVQTDRTYLNKNEMQKVEDLLLKPVTDVQRRMVLYFLLGYYTGLRVSDWARYNRKGFVQGDVFTTRTKKNGELVVIPIHDRMRRILDLLDEVGPLPADPNTELKVIQSMAGLDKNLTTHVARHSFAIRCAEVGISIETTAELMGITVKSCRYYYKVTNTKIKTEFLKWND